MGDRRERRKQETRRRLLDAAIDAFIADGDGATMDQIADRADVARSTLFNYFPGKAEVAGALFDDQHAVIEDIVRRGRASGAGTGPLLREVLGELVRWYEADPPRRARLIRAALAAGAPLSRGYFRTATILAEVIRSGRERGDVPPEVDPEAAGGVLFDAYRGVVHRWAIDEPTTAGELERRVRAAVDLCLRGVLAGPDRSG